MDLLGKKPGVSFQFFPVTPPFQGSSENTLNQFPQRSFRSRSLPICEGECAEFQRAGRFWEKSRNGTSKLVIRTLGLSSDFFVRTFFRRQLTVFSRVRNGSHRAARRVLEVTLGPWASSSRNMVWFSAPVARGPLWCTGSSFPPSGDPVLLRGRVSKLLASGSSRFQFFPMLLAIWIRIFPYSTVTLFARFRGLSTSQPRSTAIW